MVQDIKSELDKLVIEAKENLFFMHPKYTTDYIKQQASLLAQRSPEEVSRYLSASAFKLRQSCSKNHPVIPEELYVIIEEDEDETFGCEYILGKTYFDPPLLLPRSDQLKSMWEYYLTLPLNDGWCEFQEFVEKKIMASLQALRMYEDMLEREIISLEYALLSSEGTAIHNALYMHARETCSDLTEQSRLLKQTNAPLFFARRE